MRYYQEHRDCLLHRMTALHQAIVCAVIAIACCTGRHRQFSIARAVIADNVVAVSG
jgi:RNase adaptor protein for sRNA GlmZ degradation